MKLKDQVCSLEFAKKLKELGVEQKSLYCWSNAEWDERGRESRRKVWGVREKAIPEPEYSISAFTVAELGELLPFSQVNKQYCRSVRQKLGSYSCEYETLTKSEFFIADTEADARAKMLIWLLETGL